MQGAAPMADEAMAEDNTAAAAAAACTAANISARQSRRRLLAKLPKKVVPTTLQRVGSALEIAPKAEEKKEQQVNKAEEVANAMCLKTELAEAVVEAELSVLGAHVKVADAEIAAGQDSSARERQDARDEMSVVDSNDSEEREEEIEEEEKEDGEQGEDELNHAYIDEDDEWLNW
eukprot:jgi/Tetstr1/431015/TSEL_002033.t1